MLHAKYRPKLRRIRMKLKFYVLERSHREYEYEYEYIRLSRAIRYYTILMMGVHLSSLGDLTCTRKQPNVTV